ncbi:sensor histidine kinase, partial [Enterococcus faecalis]
MIFIATLIIMITFFYGVTTVQTIKEVRKNQVQALLAVGEQLAIEPNDIEALKNDHYT